MSKRNTEKNSVFGSESNTSTEEAAKEIYGDSKAPALDTGVVRAKPTDIKTIWADLSQPRRAVPTSVRGRWAGDPDELADLLEHWRIMAEGESGKKIDVVKVLKNQAALIMEEGSGEIYGRYAKLTALAASIRLEGLTNPITVFRNGSMYKIETGERRWLAHHLLAIHIDEKKFGKVLAREVEFNVFRQASENSARDGFNAIEMARQIALLIMDARRDIDGVKYDTLEDLVYAGECDRRFYAQVANGNIHRVPPGMGEKISHATGLSEARFSQYRRLLAPTEDEELNDKIWVEAEANGWTEGRIRDHVQTLTAVKVDKDETLTGVKVDNAEFQENDRVQVDNHGLIRTGTVREVKNGGYNVYLDQSQTTHWYEAAKVSPIEPDKQDYAGQNETPTTKPFTPNRDAFGQDRKPMGSSPFNPTPPQASQKPFVRGNDGEIGAPLDSLSGREVRLKDGREGTIWEDTGGPKVMFLKKGAAISNEVFRSAILEIFPLRSQTPETASPANTEPNDLSWMVGKKIRHSDPMHEGQEFEVWQAHNRQQIVNVKNERGVGFTFSAKDVTVIETPSPKTNPVKPNGKLIEDQAIYTMLVQAKHLAGGIGDTEAENSLNILSNITMGEIRRVGASNDKDAVQGILGTHYEAIAALMKKIMANVENVLNDWAMLDEAERQGE